MNLGGAILRTIYPHVCEFCGAEEAGPQESFICRKCRERHEAVRWVEDPTCAKCGLWFGGEITTTFRCANCSDLNLVFTHARSAVQYSGLVKEVIHRFKYNRNEWFEPFLAELLLEKALRDLKQKPVDVLVPIPLFPAKRRQRGFNQAERLGSHLARALGISMDTKRIARVRDTDSQAGLDRDDREANVKNAFEFRGTPFHGERVLLIDDVLTTGLTASACAKELLKNGASDVRVWTVARAAFTQ
jgi:competence protein ComFC